MCASGRCEATSRRVRNRVLNSRRMGGDNKRGWALVLGASSGFGEACSLALADAGWDIFGVHLDRKSTLAERRGDRRRNSGDEPAAAEFFNINAADEAKRQEVVAPDPGSVSRTLRNRRESRCMLHTLAFGTLKPMFGENREASLAKTQIEMTLDVMAHSLVYWTQDLVLSRTSSPTRRRSSR